MRAGLPATTTSGGTAKSTTAPAPTILPAPMCAPPSRTAPVPTHTSSSSTMSDRASPPCRRAHDRCRERVLGQYDPVREETIAADAHEAVACDIDVHECREIADFNLPIRPRSKKPVVHARGSPDAHGDRPRAAAMKKRVAAVEPARFRKREVRGQRTWNQSCASRVMRRELRSTARGCRRQSPPQPRRA